MKAAARRQGPTNPADSRSRSPRRFPAAGPGGSARPGNRPIRPWTLCPGRPRVRILDPWAWVLFLAVILSPLSSRAGEPAFLSFDHPRMVDFDLSFKRYIKALKGKPDAAKSLAALETAEAKWNALADRIPKGAERVRARAEAVRAMLLLAEARLRLDETGEALELSVPIRSEIYLLHEETGTLTAEDRMIYFHNGLLHRAEPLIAAGRYAELEALIPRMEKAAAGFEKPPAGVGDGKEEYRLRYHALREALSAYAAAIREANRYVDPEFGSAMLRRRLEGAQRAVHQRFGALYLGFP